MGNPLYTEEELKNILKTLAEEKKQEGAESSYQKKFFSKLKGSESSFRDEEVEILKGQLEKVKPALKKLVVELREAKDELESLKKNSISTAEWNHLQEILKKEEHEKETLSQLLQEEKKAFSTLQREKILLEEEKKKIEATLEQKEKEGSFSEEVIRLEKEVAAYQKKEEEFFVKLEKAEMALQAKEELLLRRQEDEEKESKRFEGERQRLVERLAESLSQAQRQAEMIQDLKEEASLLRKEYEESETIRRKLEGNAEEMKGKLSQSLEDALKAQAQTAKDLQEESQKKEALQRELLLLQKELEREKALFAIQSEEWAKKENEILSLKESLDKAKRELDESGQSALKEEYEKKLVEQKLLFSVQIEEWEKKLLVLEKEKKHLEQMLSDAEEEFKKTLSKKESAQEEILAKSYSKFRELSQRNAEMVEENHRIEIKLQDKERVQAKLEQEQVQLLNAIQNLKLQCEERDAEIRKAQQHLAKKVKETTILRDMFERQKILTHDLQTALEQGKEEAEKLTNLINLQKMQEEKLQHTLKEKTLTSEKLAKDWQEKYLTLYHECQEVKIQLGDLQKIKKMFDEQEKILLSIKQFFSKTLNLKESLEEKSLIKPTLPDDFFDT